MLIKKKKKKKKGKTQTLRHLAKRQGLHRVLDHCYAKTNKVAKRHNKESIPSL